VVTKNLPSSGRFFRNYLRFLVAFFLVAFFFFGAAFFLAAFFLAAIVGTPFLFSLKRSRDLFFSKLAIARKKFFENFYITSIDVKIFFRPSIIIECFVKKINRSSDSYTQVKSKINFLYE
jgi:hypothetical protein